ncbi:hypothetical protein [Limnobacter parvus]|uniref:Uncharacterized protein n=1 Tax=Limnobacter parvus TaxID=2939690 RepID=A0ABT1XDS1_9BURK|nr:hypothetical protein [Limnobacter parvus]MCR2745432.1 hypothetical protein [Limnobacter parvus]
MRSIMIEILRVLHRWAASAYLIVCSALAHGWFEALEHSSVEKEDAVCPVKQLIGISVHEQTQ